MECAALGTIRRSLAVYSLSLSDAQELISYLGNISRVMGVTHMSGDGHIPPELERST
jgi:hypothetical protein